jgi:hypothetical protein
VRGALVTENSTTQYIHFLLVGNSKEHLYRYISYFHPDSVVLFTSHDLAEDTEIFSKTLGETGPKVLEQINLSPFSDNALDCMTAAILTAHDKYDGNGSIISVSLTGGTNLMVLAMALVAISRRLPAFYCVNNKEQTILSIDLLQNISTSIDRSSFEKTITAGRIA